MFMGGGFRAASGAGQAASRRKLDIDGVRLEGSIGGLKLGEGFGGRHQMDLTRVCSTAAATAALALTAAAGLGTSALAAAPGGALSATLSGSAETPPGNPNGSGTASVRVDLAKQQLCYDIQVNNIGPATMAHIHKAPPGKAGPVAVPLQAPAANGKVSACAKADPAVLKDIEQNPGAYYVNVHTAKHPAGAVRGQLKK
jgi:hypothetical protein